MGFMAFTWGLTIKTLGEVLLALSVFLVHGKIIAEHKIDKKVFMEMYREEVITIISVILIVAGYFLEVMGI